MNTRTIARAATILIISLLFSACASTPHGMMYGVSKPAPDQVTGAGCEDYGVFRSGHVSQVVHEVKFEPEFIQSWETEKYCGRSGQAMIWGCYDRKNGKAYIVGRDWDTYWHEWCHAKLGGGHSHEEESRLAYNFSRVSKARRIAAWR